MHITTPFLGNKHERRFNTIFKNVLVPIDGSAIANKALKYARKLMLQGTIAQLTVLHVSPKVGDFRGSAIERRLNILSETEAKRVLAEAKAIFEESQLSINTTLLFGEPAEVILDFAYKQGVDLIIMGNQGLSAIGQFFLGNTYHKVVRLAPVPVVGIGRYAEI